MQNFQHANKQVVLFVEILQKNLKYKKLLRDKNDETEAKPVNRS